MLQKLEDSEVKINVDSKVKKQSVPNRNVLSYTGPSYYVVNLEEKVFFLPSPKEKIFWARKKKDLLG